MILSLIEEAEAIDWYEQRLAVEKDREAKAIMRNAQMEEFKHFGMNLEFLLRRTPKWRAILKDILFKEGDIVEHGRRPRKKQANSRPPSRETASARPLYYNARPLSQT